MSWGKGRHKIHENMHVLYIKAYMHYFLHLVPTFPPLHVYCSGKGSIDLNVWLLCMSVCVCVCCQGTEVLVAKIDIHESIVSWQNGNFLIVDDSPGFCCILAMTLSFLGRKRQGREEFCPETAPARSVWYHGPGMMGLL